MKQKTQPGNHPSAKSMASQYSNIFFKDINFTDFKLHFFKYTLFDKT